MAPFQTIRPITVLYHHFDQIGLNTVCMLEQIDLFITIPLHTNDLNGNALFYSQKSQSFRNLCLLTHPILGSGMMTSYMQGVQTSILCVLCYCRRLTGELAFILIIHQRFHITGLQQNPADRSKPHSPFSAT